MDPRRLRRRPARPWRRPTPPSPPAACTATPGRSPRCSTRPATSLKDFASQCEQVMPGATADAVNDILRGVMEPGGFGQNIAIDKPSAGKTGTNNSNMAVWFVGYTPTLATAAMVAGANEFGEWMTLNGQVVGGSTIYEAFGSTVAGPIWGEAMAAASRQAALRGLPDAARRRDRRRAQHGARRGRPERRGRDRGAPGRRVHRRRRRPGQLRDRRRPGRLHLTRGRRPAQQRRHGDALHLDRLRAPAAPRGHGGNGNGGGERRRRRGRQRQRQRRRRRR